VHFSRFQKVSGRRICVGLLLAIALFFNTVGTLFAGTTGTISGTVTDAKTGAPLAGVKVSATAPTAHFSATTDARGFYSFSGVSPDAYTVSFESKGYESFSTTGVNVFQDQVAQVSGALLKSLATIGRVSAHSPGGAYQPTQTQDTYTVTPQQIVTLQGKDNNFNEATLLTSLPGASLDTSGYPVLRGGRENEEGYQFEGITYSDPITNQFVNSLTINGIGSFQLVPGAGDASQGNAGTGTINYTAKRGTYPGFGQLDLEAQSAPFSHQFRFEYGLATRNGRLSDYVSFVGNRNASQYGARGQLAVDANSYYSQADNEGNDLVNNLIYKFGKNNNQSLQFLYQNQVYRFGLNVGNQSTLQYVTADPLALSPLGNGATGLTPAQLRAITQLDRGQTSLDQFARQSAVYQPNDTLKFEYTNNLSAATFLQARYYKVNAVTLFDEPVSAVPVFGGVNDFYLFQGGLRTGLSTDLTTQLNSKNLLKFGGRFEFVQPIDESISNDYGVNIASGLSPLGFAAFDFLPATNPDCIANAEPCGYLQQFFPNGVPKVPTYFREQAGPRSDYGVYVTDTFSPTDRLKIEAGLRDDFSAYHFYPGQVEGKYRHPSVIEPRLSMSYQLSKRDAVRATFARSEQFAPLSFNQRFQNKSVFTPFVGIPSFDNTTGAPAKFCINPTSTLLAPKYNSPCADYAQQLYAVYQRRVGIPIQPTLPETFTNYDFSYSHQFQDNIAVKVTPFYRRGYDQVIRVATVARFNPSTGKPILNPTVSTNGGTSHTSGVEFQLTKEADYGFSGQLSATYLNETSNVIPGSASEDFFPTVPSASLAVGNEYRVGFISPFQATLAVAYKTHGGLRINPTITYNRGYPLGNGLLTALYVNGKAYNVPLTDYTGPSANGSNYSQFTDPANPGSIFKPNVAATLGTAESSSAGGQLSNARFLTNLTVEFSPPRSRSTVGVQVTNLFNQLYASTPSFNTNLQPVSTGVLGPQTGYQPNYYQPYIGLANGLGNTPANAFRSNAYNIYLNNTPISFNVYFEQKL